jgi:serine/threonine-protein kinase HipA
MPLYDVLTAQPSFDDRQIERRQMKLAMSVGKSRHYRIDTIQARQFRQTGEEAGMPKSLVRSALEEIAADAETALAAICFAGPIPPIQPQSIWMYPTLP